MTITLNTKELSESLFKKLCASNEALELIINPTENCNFRCTYCYEDYKIGKMGGKVIQGIHNLIRKRLPNLKNFRLQWFGGEPLLAFDIIEDVCSSTQFLLESYPNVKYTSVMTTNGFLLTKHRLIRLYNLGVREFQISLDGDGEIHNSTRRCASGDPTFDVIWKNLLAAKSTSLNFNILLRIHFHSENILLLGSLIERINKSFSNDSRFKVFFKPIRNLGGENGKNLIPFDKRTEQQLLEFFSTQLAPEIERYSIAEDIFSNICYASKPNSFLIRPNGQIGKCTVALDEALNNIGHLNPDGTLQIDNELLRHWFLGFETLDLDSLRCPYSALNLKH